jgi:hypothetical protein
MINERECAMGDEVGKNEGRDGFFILCWKGALDFGRMLGRYSFDGHEDEQRRY